ncbi:MAG: FlgD immunoglobulin-like domain containing protein [Candidatus Margulisiibacteriota bacterium]
MPLPDYVNDVKYSLTSNTSGVKVSPSSGDKNTTYGAEDLATAGINWTTNDDNSLLPTAGLIKSPGLIFNEKEFYGRRELKISDFYSVKDDYQSVSALKYTFVKNDPFGRTSNSPIDNPNVVITGWNVALKDKTGGTNKDIVLEKVDTTSDKDWQSHWKSDKIKLKLKLDASESRYVEVLGNASGPYELMYFDGKTWKTFVTSNSGASGRLGWWNVGRLNGKYTVLIKSGSYIATKDVSIGTLIEKEVKMSAYSTYKRAQLEFPKGAFVNGSKLPQDQLVTITPVAMNEIYIRNRPIIITSGPIVEIKPSPWKFDLDKKPTLKFIYTFDDLADPKLGLWDMSKPLPEPGESKLNLPMNIHQVTAGGDLQIVAGNRQEVELNNGELQYAFYAPLDHFSTYALLPGKFSLSAPIVLADRYITNKETVNIHGTAEPDSILDLYVVGKNDAPPPFLNGSGGGPDVPIEGSEVGTARRGVADPKGNFEFKDVALITEGKNTIYVTSHPKDTADVMTFSDVTIIKDTVPPSVEAKQNLYAFSPNGDGKYDSVDYALKTNENGKIYLSVMSNANSSTSLGAGGVTRNLLNQEISAEANKEVKLTWGKDNFQLYRRDNATGQWILFSEIPISERLADGAYNTIIYAIDEAGNIANNVISQTIVDTTPPTILGLNADPNPFTPNDDGVKDTTKFWYKFSEPVYTTLSIYRDDSKLFRTHEGPTENFVYPTVGNRDVQSQVSSSGDWPWDGRGSRNELLGGTYSWEVYAEDWVGNSVTSEIKAVVVDRVPTLIPYAFAEPDPFAPVNPNNSFTEIKYYLGRDNLKVKAWIVGAEGKTIKTLIADELQGKGEHIARWYGDFESAYDGPTASANKYRVADGSYVFKVWAEDPSEPASAGKPGAKPAESSNTVLVDNVPPNILVKGLAVDYRKNKAELTYSIPENSSVEVSVFDKDGMLLAAVITGESQTAGEHLISYPISGEGERYFKIVAEDRAKNIAEAKTDAFAASPDTFRLASHQASPATFTPNGDGLTDLTRISYGLAGGVPDYAVGLDIRTPTGSTVKNLITNDPQGPGNYSFYWDGRDNAGNMALDGYYSYVIKAEDKLGAKVEEQGTILLVSARPTVDLSTSAPIFSPNGDDAKDSVNFNYSVNYPTMYISGEALVKIEVLNSSSEAVWSKTFNHTAGSYVYEYNGLGNDGNPLPAGDYYARVSGQDALYGTAIPKTISLTVDYSVPEPTDFSIDPPYAKLDSDVGIKLSFPETLEAAPSVKLTLNNGAAKTANLTTVEGNSYEYHYLIIDEDAEGPVEVSVEARDLALNPINKIKTFVIDKTNPSVSDLSVLPNPASIPSVNGQVSVKFNVSEALKEAPKVYVTQNGASPQLLVISGQWQVANGQVEAKFDPIPGYDGPALITVESTDLADNITRYALPVTLVVDTIKPVFSGIQSEISGNELPKYAKEGAEVKITFNSSEPLKFNPEVKVNGNPANYDSLSAGEYTYKYTISGSDTNGNAALSIAGYDFAMNNGTAETSSSSESFVIDLVNPTVAIAAPNTPDEDISNPWSFATNEDPNNPNVHRSTTFYYSLPEPSKVTVKVHKVFDSQTTYTKADFNSGNLIKTLVSDIWQNAGKRAITWEGTITDNITSYDTNGDGFAVPGKYAFIVEGRDRAGNLTLKKWGGTVWIQDNVLTLKEPDQQDFSNAKIIPTPEVNPDPHCISPNGNSVEPAQKWARFYFMIPLTLNPASGVPQPPERIEASWTAAPIKKVGKYSVKVYSDSSLTNLVRTITSEADAYSASLTYENWDGKNDANQFVTDGTYYMVVDVRDYAGNAAVDNLLKRSVVVDNTMPVAANLSAAPYYFAPGPGTNSTIKSTTLTYEVSDNSGKVFVSIDTYRDANGNGLYDPGVDQYVVNLVSQEAKTANNSVYDLVWAPTNIGTVYNSGFNDGKYLFKVTVIDEAGNSAEVKTKDVYVDTAGPTFAFSYPNITNDMTPALSVSNPSDTGGSGLHDQAYQFAWRVNNGSWNYSDWLSSNSWTPTLTADSTDYDFAAKVRDKVGNDSGWQYDNDNTLEDDPPTGSVSINSGAANTNSTSVTLTLSATDNLTGVTHMRISNDNSSWSTYAYSTSYSWSIPSGDGTKTVYVQFRDGATNWSGSFSDNIVLDQAPPTDGSISINGGAANTNSTSVTLTLSATDNLTGVTHMRISNDNSSWSTYAYSTSYPWSIPSGDGTKTVYVQFRDGATNWSGSFSDNIVLDQTPPTDGSISINGGAANTNSTSVTLTLSATDNLTGVTHMRISNDNSSWSTYAYSTSYPWSIPSGDGTKTVYVQFRDGATNWSGSFSDNIVLDQTPPSGSVLINQGAQYTNSKTASLSLSASDGLTGVTDMQISVDQQGTWQQVGYNNSYSPANLPGGDGARYAHVKYRDGAGNWSTAFGDLIYLYESGPKTISAGPAQIVTAGWWWNHWLETYDWGDEQSEKDSSTFTLPYDMRINITCRANDTGSTDGPYTGVYQIRRKSDETIAWTATLKDVGDTSTWATSDKVADLSAGTYYVYIGGTSGQGDADAKVIITGEPANFVGHFSGISVATQSATFEAPILTAPDNNKQNVGSIRPTFAWQHHKGETTEYKIDVAKNDTFTIANQSFAKSANTGSPDSADPALFNYTYSIHEFDPGLDKDTYYWKVTALATNEAATSEVWSFTIQPDLTLTGITNYPNPFSPNREKTKIRYKLGADADEVKIRIYDITGSLVTELDGTTNGESSSIWSKYNDIEWDGRNGRGDMVMNGIYPYEVIARLGDKSLSGRGKIAVLK